MSSQVSATINEDRGLTAIALLRNLDDLPQGNIDVYEQGDMGEVDILDGIGYITKEELDLALDCEFADVGFATGYPGLARATGFKTFPTSEAVDDLCTSSRMNHWFGHSNTSCNSQQGTAGTETLNSTQITHAAPAEHPLEQHFTSTTTALPATAMPYTLASQRSICAQQHFVTRQSSRDFTTAFATAAAQGSSELSKHAAMNARFCAMEEGLLGDICPYINVRSMWAPEKQGQAKQPVAAAERPMIDDTLQHMDSKHAAAAFTGHTSYRDINQAAAAMSNSALKPKWSENHEQTGPQLTKHFGASNTESRASAELQSSAHTLQTIATAETPSKLVQQPLLPNTPDIADAQRQRNRTFADTSSDDDVEMVQVSNSRKRKRDASCDFQVVPAAKRQRLEQHSSVASTASRSQAVTDSSTSNTEGARAASHCRQASAAHTGAAARTTASQGMLEVKALKDQQLIWAKFSKFPYWPAKVEKVSQSQRRQRQMSDDQVLVTFFGPGEEFAIVPITHVQHWDVKPKKNGCAAKGLQQAIKMAEKALADTLVSA